MKELRGYVIVLEPEEEGGYSVSVPAFPEAHTQGETIAEAMANAREVISLCVETRLDLGQDIPESDDSSKRKRYTVSMVKVRV